MVVQDGGCTTCNFPGRTLYTWYAQRFGYKSGGFMQTYAIAAIGVQNRTWASRPSWIKSIYNTPHTHWGIAKVSDAEMDTAYGDPVMDGKKFRGYGLGMKGQDQTKPTVAVEAIIRRIQIVTNACDEKCTDTDIFLIASLAQNGPNFNLDNLDIMKHGKDYTRLTGGTHSLDWETYVKSSDTTKKIDLIRH